MRSVVGVRKARRAALARNILIGFCILQQVTIQYVVWNASNRDREVILMPPMPGESMSAGAAKPDARYMTQLCSLVSSLWLEISPGSTDFNKQSLQSMARPSTYGDLSKVIEDDIVAAKNDRVSTDFITYETETNVKSLSCLVVGEYRRFLGKEMVSTRQRGFEYRFVNAVNRLWLDSIRELTDEEIKKKTGKR